MLTIILKSAGYTPCMNTDVGLEVSTTYGGVTSNAGYLMSYDNATYTWVVMGAGIILQNATLSVIGGSGAGTCSSSTLGYCSIDDVKSRALIKSADATQDTSVQYSITEAGDFLENELSMYLRERPQTIALDQDQPYVNVVPSDIGLIVMSGSTPMGWLRSANNVTKIWVMENISGGFEQIQEGNTLTLLSGDGITAGIGSGVALVDGYFVIGNQEVDMVHGEWELSVGDLIPVFPVLSEICADIATGIYKRRFMPTDMDQGWWNLGLKKLQQFIAKVFTKPHFVFISPKSCVPNQDLSGGTQPDGVGGHLHY